MDSSGTRPEPLGNTRRGVQDVLPFGVASAEMHAVEDRAVSRSERQARWEREWTRHKAGFGQHKTIAEYLDCPDCHPGWDDLSARGRPGDSDDKVAKEQR